MMQARTYLSSSVTYPEITRDHPRLPESAGERHVGDHRDGARDGHLVRRAGEHNRTYV